MSIKGNFYGKDRAAAERDADRLNARNDGSSYEVFPSMQHGGYQIAVYRDSDGKDLGCYDDGDQWSNPPASKWCKL